MLDINPGLILWTIITFVLLLFILGKVAWKPLMNALQAREQSIRDALLKAEEARKESERLLAENTAGDEAGERRNVPHSERRTRLGRTDEE